MIIYLGCYLLSFLSAGQGFYHISGILLMGAAVYLYVLDYRKSGSPIHLRGLFSLAWVGGQGLSCLKLSRLQSPWAIRTWICFLAAQAGFWCAFELLSRLTAARRAVSGRGAQEQAKREAGGVNPGLAGRLAAGICIVTAVSWAAFLVEAFKLGYVPFFVRGVPHAYSEFHISGVHYFTVSCVLVPGLAVLYGQASGWKRDRRGLLAAAGAALSMLIPVLCVSRFQLIFGVVLGVLTYIATQRRVRWTYVAGASAGMVVLYLVLTVARSHDVAYLNSIFEMRNPSTPIFITQPYMYIANNYDNFNCLVEAMGSGGAAHTMGLKQAFPLFVFSGLKFKYPQLVSFPLFTTKKELTTVTLFYDAFYDFGLLGVILLAAVLGAASWILARRISGVRNPVGYLFYGQMALYLMLSFFTTWFTNPATWFYFIVTGMLYLLCEIRGRNNQREGEAQ